MISITWFGTATILIKSNDKNILFDPFIRYSKLNDIEYINRLSNFKNILITHGHIDHTLHLEKLYKNKCAKIYCTNSPYNRLHKKMNNLVKIKYNDSIKIDNFNIKVLPGKHIKFDLKLIFKTLFNKNIIKYFSNLVYLSFNHIKCRENKETVIYYIEIDNIKILLMGSMELNNIDYPKNVDYLILPFQGRSDLDKKVIPIIDKINPKKIFLSHFDNSFPPISTNVSTSTIKKNYKNIIIPEYELEYIIKK